jgi:hypothetical protein
MKFENLCIGAHFTLSTYGVNSRHYIKVSESEFIEFAICWNRGLYNPDWELISGYQHKTCLEKDTIADWIDESIFFVNKLSNCECGQCDIL